MKLSINDSLARAIPFDYSLDFFGISFNYVCEYVLNPELTHGLDINNIDWNEAERQNQIYIITAWKNNKLVDVVKIGETYWNLLVRSKTFLKFLSNPDFKCNRKWKEYTCDGGARLSRYINDIHTNRFVRDNIKSLLNQSFDIRAYTANAEDVFSCFNSNLNLFSLFENNEWIPNVKYYSSNTYYDVRNVHERRKVAERELILAYEDRYNQLPAFNENRS
jgi:hypothetical protein